MAGVNRHVYINNASKRDGLKTNTSNKVLVNPKFLTTVPKHSSNIHVNPSKCLNMVPKTSNNIHVNPSFFSLPQKPNSFAHQKSKSHLHGSSARVSFQHNFSTGPSTLWSHKGTTFTNHAGTNGLNVCNKSNLNAARVSPKCHALVNESTKSKASKFKFIKTDSNTESALNSHSGFVSKSTSTSPSKYKYKYSSPHDSQHSKTSTNQQKTYSKYKSGPVAQHQRSTYKADEGQIADTASKHEVAQATPASKHKTPSSKSKYRKTNDSNATRNSIKYKYNAVLKSRLNEPVDSKRSRNKVYVKRKVTSAANSRTVKRRRSSTPGRQVSYNGADNSAASDWKINTVNTTSNHRSTSAVNASVNRQLSSPVNRTSNLGSGKSSAKYTLIRKSKASPKHKLVRSSRITQCKLVGAKPSSQKYKLVRVNRTPKYKLDCANNISEKYRLVRANRSPKYRLDGANNVSGKYRLVRARCNPKYSLACASDGSGKYKLVKTGKASKFKLVSADSPSGKYRFVSPRTTAQHRFRNTTLILRRSARRLGRKSMITLHRNATAISRTGRTWKRYSAEGGRNKYRYNVKNSGSRRLLHTPGRYRSNKNVFNVNDKTSRSRAAASQVLQKTKSFLMMQRKKSSQLCLFYTKFGKCSSKDKRGCPYKHDPQKVAVCRRFLSGKCQDNDCLLSHEVAPEKMPTCTFFLRGVCVKENCPYLHVKVNPNAEICKDFVNGYCSKGVECRLKHELEPSGKEKRVKRKGRKTEVDASKANKEEMLRANTSKVNKVVRVDTFEVNKRVKVNTSKAKKEETVDKEVLKEPTVRYYNIEEEFSDTKRKRENESTTEVLTTKKRRLSGSLPSYIPLN